MKQYLLPSLAALALLSTACDDDDTVVLEPLATPQPAVAAADYQGLTFQWDRVPGASQYAYELTDQPGNLIARDLTVNNHLEFTGLQPATTYILKVSAFGDVKVSSQSSVITLEATTDPLREITTLYPEHTVYEDNAHYIEWEAPAEVSWYEYSLTNDATGAILDQGESYDYYVFLGSLTRGSYTFTLQPFTEEPGYVPQGPVYTLQFTVEGSAYDLQGAWNILTVGSFYDADWEEWENTNWSHASTITVGQNDREVVIRDFYWRGYPMTGIYDPQAETITFSGCSFNGFQFGTNTSASEPVVANVSADHKAISFPDWNGWRDGRTFFRDASVSFSR